MSITVDMSHREVQSAFLYTLYIIFSDCWLIFSFHFFYEANQRDYRVSVVPPQSLVTTQEKMTTIRILQNLRINRRIQFPCGTFSRRRAKRELIIRMLKHKENFSSFKIEGD